MIVRLLLAVAWLGCASPTVAQLTGVEGRVPLPTEDDWNRVAGSYHLRVCQRGGMCADDADPDVSLTYVVSIQRDGMPIEVVADLRNKWTLHFWPPSTPDGFNACYVVVRTIRHIHPAYLSLSGVGLFDARLGRQDAKVALVLGGGPMDEFYLVDAVSIDGRLEGIGRSYDAPKHQSDAWPSDTVVGVRTGPPDTQPCIHAARDSLTWRRLADTLRHYHE